MSESRKVVKGSDIFWVNETGHLHREDGPAVEYCSGTKRWYLNGELHREDGPAVELDFGTKEWFFNGKRHRVGGPAIERSDGTKEWFVNGKRHRVNGPAIEWPNGFKVWHIKGICCYSEEEWFNSLTKEEQMAYLFNMGDDKWNQ